MRQVRASLMAGAAIAAMAGALTSGRAFAQEERAAPLDTITVTARKREENVQQTPIALTAFSQATLEDRQIFNVNEIAQYVPNLQASYAAGGSTAGSSFSIRGIGQADFITTTDPGVGTYLDGVYLARVTGAALELADIERIEVLRGPQGTLFGRNTIGGAVSVVTAKPSGEFGLKGELTAGSFARFQGRAILDAPLVEDVLAAKIAVFGKTSNGYGKDIEPLGGSGDLGADDDIAGRIQLRFTPGDGIEFNLSGDYSRRRGTQAPQGRVFFDPTSAVGMIFDDGGANDVIGVNGDVDSDDLDRIAVDTPMTDDLDVYGVSLISDFDLGGADLKLITAYRGLESQSGQDFDGGNDPILNQFIDSEQWQFSQEIQLTGVAMDGALDWLVGGYFFTEDGRFDTDANITGTQVLVFTNNKTDSYAGFAQGTYRLRDRFAVTGGLRYTSETKKIDIDTTFGGFPLVTDGIDQKTFDALTAKGSLEFQATEDLLLYASISQGFRSGGYNGRPFSPTDLAPFDAERSLSYEGGVKSDLADGRLRLNLAGFFNKYDDVQLTATTMDSMGGFIVITDNAGEINLYGFEAEMQAAPTDALRLFAQLGHTNTDNLKPKTGFTIGANTLPLASEWTAGGGLEYTVPLGDAYEATFGADASYRSSYYPQFNNSPIAEEDGYTLVNARLALRPTGGAWSLTFWGKNLTDEVYRSFGQDGQGGGTPAVVAIFAPTREYGVTLAFDF
ncbi:TonB-dependent receptor [Hyphococcus sp.]|uniref:TonB-dependent receptor n=1 Tax=Hyphococcus sp. TaxID=2038636 RepID=UPI0035C72485